MDLRLFRPLNMKGEIIPKDNGMNTCKEVNVWIHVFLTTEIVGIELLVSRPGCFTSVEKAPRTH
jgi:hypothetical protein